MALTQVSSAGIKNAEVKTEDILDANITTAKIAADAVTGAKIADDAIGAEHIEDLDSHVKLLDNSQAIFGTGEDLKIYHNGSNSYIINSTGETWLRGNDVRIADTAGEWMGQFAQDAAVKLYYDNSKKFETTSTGTTTTGNATITGHIYQGDSDVHYFGAGPDLAIWHSGSHGFIRNTEGNLYIYSADGHDGHVVIQATYGEESIICEDNGAVKLYYDNSTKLETVSYGAKIYQDLDLIGDTPQIKFDDTTSSGYQSYINTNKNELKIMASAGGFGVYCGTDANGASNTTQRFWVNGAGLVRLPTDDSKLQIGASQDIEIYHNGTYSFIKNATGSLTLQSPGLIQLLNADASEYYIEAVENGAVSLYYDNGKVFETTASGAKVSGILECTSHVKLGDNDVFVAGAGDDLQIYHDGNNSYIHDSGTGSLILRSSRVSFNDTSNNENARLDSDGLKFNGDSAAANALSDYEEGSFTAAITVDTGTNPSQNAYTHRYAYYRKIGKIVHFRVDVQFGAISSTGSGSAVLSGLPFASSNSTQAYGVTFSSGYSPNWGTNNHPTAAYINTNSSEMYLMKNTVADGVSYVNSANIVNGTRLICGGTYMTDS